MPARPARPGWAAYVGAVPLIAVVVVAACTGSGPGPASPADAPGDESADAETNPSAGFVLPERPGERRQTTGDVPHIQTDAAPVPAVDAELRRRAFSLPGVEDRESRLSLPGARGLVLADDVEIVRRDVLAAGTEFAHIHPDSSLHVWLPVDRAVEVDRTKWGELHPWVNRDGFWDGVVMVYTPETIEEVDITMQILVEAYNFVTGASLDHRDFP